MNTFGSATKQFGLFDARAPRANRKRFARGAERLLERVNHLYVPAGCWATRGWLLALRSEYDQLSKYSTAFQLSIGDPTKSDNVGVIKNLAIVQARCVTRGLAADPDALYLVEVTDGRGVLHNRWFSAPLTTKYNIRAPAYPQTFHPDSLNSGTTWTWSTMLQDMWTKMNAAAGNVLGTWPGLPAAPAGTPEGFWFSGVPAWPAFCDVLEHVGLAVVCDLTQDSPFTIVAPGSSDAAFTALQARYGSSTGPLYRLEDDLEWIDTGAARVPATVIVLFRRRNSVYGTEETVRYDSQQWDMTPYYSVSVAAPSTFASAVGTHHLWSDFTVRYDQDGSPLAADVVTAAAIAQERVTQYFRDIYAQTAGHMDQTYSGALPFATGSLVDGVCWYMGERGWRTRIVRGGEPPFEGVW